MNALDLPLCAVCRTRVARVERVFDPNANRGLGAHTLIAHCHGERDVVDISDEDLLAMVPDSMRAGVAFTRGGFIGRATHDAAAGARVEVDLRDAAFSAPRPYVARSGFRYGADHGDTPNGPPQQPLNGALAFRLSSSHRRSRTR
jgi:hypothetical protein